MSEIDRSSQPLHGADGAQGKIGRAFLGAASPGVAQREVWINDHKADEVSGAHGATNRDWKVLWDNNLVSSGPSVAAKTGDIIAIKDGVTYIGLIPIAINAMERRREVRISYEFPVMLVHSYLYDGDTAVDSKQLFNKAKVPLSGFVIEKGGAAIVSEPKHETYLLAAPEVGTYIGYNPLPDPIDWSMSVPGGVHIDADGKLGIARIVIKPKENKIWFTARMRAAAEW